MIELIDPAYEDYLKFREWLRGQLGGRNLWEFASKSGVPHGTIYMVLHTKRKRDIRYGTLKMIAKGLNMTVSEMLQKAGL